MHKLFFPFSRFYRLQTHLLEISPILIDKWENNVIKQNSIFIKISENENHEFKLSSGRAFDFIAEQTVIVNDKNPNVLWNLLYNLAGIPLPIHVDPKKIISEFLEQEALKNPPKEEENLEEQNKGESLQNPPQEIALPQKELSDIEKELSTLSSREIVSKVLNDKGIEIKNSLKSKAAILRKALKIYEN
jgi:hypothetical protein